MSREGGGPRLPSPTACLAGPALFAGRRARKPGRTEALIAALVFSGLVAFGQEHGAAAGDAASGRGDAVAPVVGGAGGGAGAKLSDNVRIQVIVSPPQKAHVFWGVKDFGVAPLEIERPRGSGPLDLVLRAPGYLVFHTRAFTEHDDKIFVSLSPAAGSASTSASGGSSAGSSSPR